jgi:predicted nucleic acid-binding protein
MTGQPLTSPDGPVVVSTKTLCALIDIRRQKLLPQLFGPITMALSNFQELTGKLPQPPDWLAVVADHPQQPLPERLAHASDSQAATLRLAVAVRASNVLIDGPIKEAAKLSFIKSEGTVSILVRAYRAELLTSVRPMVKALEALGHGDVLPPPDLLEALWKALDNL